MIGRTIAQYRILEKLGAGGLGVVYKAEDTRLQRIVALKFLRPEVIGDEEHRARFLREARAAAALDHPHICTVYEIGEVEGDVFIAMAFIDGVGLDEKIKDGPLAIDEAAGIAIQIGTALREAHDRGLIHRDIKSANVRITSRGQAKLLDFGLAKRAGEAEMTQAGTIMGTVACMSPEQARGEAADRRTDIWSLGVMLYEMVTGQLPFRAQNPAAVLHAVLHDEPAALSAARSDVPAPLEQIVARALAKDPAERYQQIDEMLADLRGLVAVGERDSTETVVVPTGAVAPVQESSLWQRLWRRRVPQAIILYAIGAAAIVLFLRWLVQRYPVSPQLPSFAMLLLLCLLPSVFLLVYFRRGGRAGASRPAGARIPRIGVPLNLALAAVLLIAVFQGKQLGAATTTIALENEAGEMVTREVPRSEFRKRLAIFPFDSQVADSTSEWLAYGIVYGLVVDLSQDPYVHTGMEFATAMKEAGFSRGVDIPWSLKREIAERLHYPFFITGTYRATGDSLRIDPVLYETFSGDLVERRVLRGPLGLELIDSLAVQLKRDLGIPSYHIKQVEDLPLTTLLSESLEAFREASEGFSVWTYTNDYAGAAEHFERAVEIDPTFAWARLYLGAVYTGLGRREDGLEAYRQALKHDYRLSETSRFMLRALYHYGEQDFRAGLAAAQNWSRLQPHSIEARELLVQGYTFVNQPDSAIAEMEAMLALDPERHDLLHEIGSLLQLEGRYDEALEYYEEYADRLPDKAESYTALAALHRERGAFDDAKRYYEKARVLEPDRLRTLGRLADLEVLLGNYEQAENQLRAALERAETAEDRGRMYQSLTQLYARRGQIERAIETTEQFIEAYKEIGAPAQVTALRLGIPVLHARVGKMDAALAGLELLGQEGFLALPAMRWLLALGYLTVYTTLGDPAYLEEARSFLEEAHRGIEASGFEMGGMPVILGQGQILAMEQRYREAIPEFERSLEITYPDEEARREAYLGLAQCHRELGEYDQAEAWIHRILDVDPHQPRALAEAARIAWARGKHEEAQATMRQAIEVWRAADPGFVYAERARETLAKWGEAS